MLCVSKCTRNVLVTASLSYKNTYISEKDKISVIKKKLFLFTNFSVHSKIIFMFNNVHRCTP